MWRPHSSVAVKLLCTSMRMIPFVESTTLIAASPFRSTGVPCGPINIHVSSAFDAVDGPIGGG